MGHRASPERRTAGPVPVIRPVSVASLLDPSRPQVAVGVLGLSQLAEAAKAGRRSRGGGSRPAWSWGTINASGLLAEVSPTANR